jgi:hypothetical protein
MSLTTINVVRSKSGESKRWFADRRQRPSRRACQPKICRSISESNRVPQFREHGRASRQSGLGHCERASGVPLFRQRAERNDASPIHANRLATPGAAGALFIFPRVLIYDVLGRQVRKLFSAGIAQGTMPRGRRTNTHAVGGMGRLKPLSLERQSVGRPLRQPMIAGSMGLIIKRESTLGSIQRA